MRFYTNFAMRNGQLLLREIIDGHHVNTSHQCRPFLFEVHPDGRYETVDGRKCNRMDFKSVKLARKFLDDYDAEVKFRNPNEPQVAEVLGSTNFAYPMINEMYPGEMEYDTSKITVAYLDIEVTMTGAKPDVDKANQEILSIAVKVIGTVFVFSCLEYEVRGEGIKYVKCSDEKEMLERFLKFWAATDVDVVTGWFIDLFDIPYLVNRIERVLGQGQAARLSPWDEVKSRRVTLNGRDNETYSITGVSIVDYMRAYRKFTYKERESYRLDFICEVELGEKKLDYSEYGTLDKLAVENPQKFIDYNVRDVLLVEKLDDKLKLLDLIFTVAYYCKISYDDTFGTVKMWETLIHNELMSQSRVVPLKVTGEKRAFEGGYVKQPQVGRHRWIASFDFDSLYPHIVMALNISSDTVIGPIGASMTVDDFLNGKLDAVRSAAGDNVVAASGIMFDRKKQGFFPRLMNKMYARREALKVELRDAKRAKEAAKDEASKKAAENVVARLNALQKALKYALNSGYGAMSNEYFLWFNMWLAESITLSGQFSIRYTFTHFNTYLNRMLGTSGVDYVITADTDSMYVDLSVLVDKMYTIEQQKDVQAVTDFIDRVCRDAFIPKIKEITLQLCDYLNAYDRDKLRMKRETIADAGIFTAKKKYALREIDVEEVRLAKPKIKAVGLEMVKSSTPAKCRDYLKRALEIMLTGTEDELQRYVKEKRTEFYSLRFEETAFPRGVNGINKYTDEKGNPILGTPQHTWAAIAYNRALTQLGLTQRYPVITDGDKIKFGYLRMPNEVDSEVIAFVDVVPTEFKIDECADRAKQFEKAFLGPLDIILQPIGWSAEPRSSLASFF
jgi:Kyanoviridae DNA polymerase